MSSLTAACALFLGLHWIIAGSPLRGVIVSRTGEKPFRMAFSLAIAVSLVWMGWAFAHAPYIETWGKADMLKPLSLALMAFAFILLGVGAFAKNMNILTQNEPDQVKVGGILRITRNPALIGLGLWGLAHFIINGDWAAHLLFGSFAFQGLIGPLNMERKYRNKYGAAWDGFSRQTSHIPFLAILTGRNRLVLSEINQPIFAASLAAYAIVLYYHNAWFGASPLP